MAKISTQTLNGKAFEYALLNEFFEKLKTSTEVSIVKNETFATMQKIKQTKAFLMEDEAKNPRFIV